MISFPMPPVALYRYTPDRGTIHPQNHLRAFSGIVQADAYAGFNALYERTHNPATEAACWAHARRNFFDVHAATWAAPGFVDTLFRAMMLNEVRQWFDELLLESSSSRR